MTTTAPPRPTAPPRARPTADTEPGCLCCGAGQTRLRGRRKGYIIRACAACRFEFVHPLPRPQAIDTHYRGYHSHQERHSQQDPRARVAAAVAGLDATSCRRRWFDWAIGTARKLLSKRELNILELGSGLGLFVHHANSTGCHAVGTEISAELAEAGQGIINGRIEHFADAADAAYAARFGEHTFDMIYMEHVFEHLMQPREVLEQLKPCLRPGGVLVMSVPNHRSLPARLFGLRWGWTSPPAHLYYYNRRALTQLLANAGFEVELVRTGDYYFRSIHQFYSLRTVFNKVGASLNEYLGTSFATRPHQYGYPTRLSNYLNLLPYWLLYPVIKLGQSVGMGTELTVVCRKPRS